MHGVPQGSKVVLFVFNVLFLNFKNLQYTVNVADVWYFEIQQKNALIFKTA